MRAGRAQFLAAVQPVLADVERCHPGLLRLELEPGPTDERQAWLWEPDGSASGLFLGDGHDTPADAVAELADHVRDVVADAVQSAWPVCPRHATSWGHGLAVTSRAGRPVWACPQDGEVVAPVGDLPARARPAWVPAAGAPATTPVAP